MPNIVFEKPFSNGSLLVAGNGKTYILWHLTIKELACFGKQISPFTCFRKHDFCERHLKRPHLTCFTCKILKVVSEKMPLFYPIQIRQIWEQSQGFKMHDIFFRNALSLAEFFS